MKPRIILTRLFALLFILFSVVIFSCSKESSGGTDSEEQEVSEISSESDAEAEIVFNGIFDDVIGVSDDVGMGGIGIFGRGMRTQGCQNVTVEHLSSTLFPVKVTIDFGPTPCMGADGHTRSGKIIVIYTGRLIVPGASATTTFDNFYTDSINVTGTHKITNSSQSNTQPISRQFKVEVANAKLTKHNGNYIEWNCNKTITQLEGLLTPDMPRDDAFKIEGTSRGKALRGNILVAWQSSITEPLLKKFLCPWIVKGIIKSIRANVTNNDPRWHSVLNFGNGACDRKATLTINGVSTEITLR